MPRSGSENQGPIRIRTKSTPARLSRDNNDSDSDTEVDQNSQNVKDSENNNTSDNEKSSSPELPERHDEGHVELSRQGRMMHYITKVKHMDKVPLAPARTPGQIINSWIDSFLAPRNKVSIVDEDDDGQQEEYETQLDGGVFRDDQSNDDESSVRRFNGVMLDTVDLRLPVSLAMGRRQIEKKEKKLVHPTLPEVSVKENQNDLNDYYRAILNSSHWSVQNLNVKPGDSDFLIWFLIDSYFPLFSACAGPLSNMTSVCSIVCCWKETKDGHFVKDDAWLYALNSLSVLLAIISNTSLLLNFRKKIRYDSSQFISITGWFFACLILTGCIVGFHVDYMNRELYHTYRISSGFWYACISVIIHFCNFLLLAMNELGFILKKYEPVFNIDDVQRSLITQSLLVAAWLLIGAVIFSRLFHLDFAEAMFYCVNTIVSIGAQSYVPSTQICHFLSIIWTVISLVLFGLMVYTIREMVLVFSQSTLYWNRLHKMESFEMENSSIASNSSRQNFEKIRSISQRANLVEGLILLGFNIFSFFVLTLGGALAFSLFENWSYSFSIFFCVECVATLGDGITQIYSPGGQAFFTIWALCAIPVMTMLVSSLSDLVFYRLTTITDTGLFDFCADIAEKLNFGGIMNPVIKSLRETSIAMLPNNHEDDIEYQQLNDDDSNDSSMDYSTPKEHAELLLEKGKHADYLNHPMDNVIHTIMKTGKVSDLSFLSSDGFIKSFRVKVNLANYNREGKVISSEQTDFLRDRKNDMVKLFREVDPDFDPKVFRAKYHHNSPLVKPADRDLNGRRIVKTKFQMKDDYFLSSLSNLQVLIIELEKSLTLTELDPEHKYDYSEWNKFLRLTENEAYKTLGSAYWFSEESPFSFPNFEPRYFAHHYLHQIDLRIQKLALDYDTISSSNREPQIDNSASKF
ncbi:unnamed protein product [Ambrosiozyma monospora]|uniref:Unnamed protein product n=1 Tax=Ambrosiozyma monospora TaxID=43982 RepID=A0A9W7DCU4_AMBMO|nr:unnamed protein product [Ambrosiozyma monospora]